MSGVPIGIIFSNQIFGIFYDLQATDQGSTTGICYGKSCYQSAFIVSTGLQFISFILSILLFRYRMSRPK
jgi:hypothetical protein